MSIKIIIADDHKLVSTSLIPLLNSQAGMQVVAEASSGKKAVELASKLKARHRCYGHRDGRFKWYRGYQADCLKISAHKGNNSHHAC